MRSLTASAKNAFSQLNFPSLALVELDFADGFVRVCNAAYTFNWDSKGNLITDTEALSSHTLYTVGLSSEITDLGSSISNGVAHVYFSRTGTSGSDRRIRTSNGSYSISVDKTQVSTLTFDFKQVQGFVDFYALGSAVDDQANSHSRIFTIASNGTITAYSGCLISDQIVLENGFTRISVKIPASFWTGSGATFYIFVGGGWTTVETKEYYYTNPTFVQDGTQWLGIGTLGSIEAITEGTALQMYGCQLTLSGIPPEVISEAFTQTYQGRSATIWLAPLTEDYVIIADPVVVFKGRMDTMDIALGETCTVTVSVESRLVDWERPRIRRFNDEDQRSEYPNDRGFRYVDQMIQKDLKWNRSN